ncbi:MAG: hypothetical protein HOQ09_04300 [Gemmatimonadaceae bacterium]|nr:hypothetical protein [Gemmatimonadaceae bacterium]
MRPSPVVRAVIAGVLLTAGNARAQTGGNAGDTVSGKGTLASPVVVAPRAVTRAFAADAGTRDLAGRERGALPSLPAGIAPRSARVAASPRSEWWAPAASAVLPGAGQARLRQDRFVAYLAVEGFLWARYAVDHRAGVEQRSQYRDLALRVSRAPFPGPKPQGDFEYYERMEHWIASGVYDSDPGPGLVPETDTTTFNGAMWRLARKTYWSSPTAPPPVGSAAYDAALRFYQQYAVRPEFQWSWRDTPLHQDIYRRHIRASNDAFRRTITDLGAVIANHALSTVDAYVSLRLRLRDASAGADAGVDLGTSVSFRTLGSIVRRARSSTPE